MPVTASTVNHKPIMGPNSLPTSAGAEPLHREQRR